MIALYVMLRLKAPHICFSLVSLQEPFGMDLRCAFIHPLCLTSQIQDWISSLLIKHKKLNPEDMRFLQILFTILWSIWNHRNVVVHDNIQPNPLGVLLMAQTMSCKYQEAFGKEESHHLKEFNHSNDPNPAGGQWQRVLKLAGAKRRSYSGSAYAYEAKNKQGEVVFWGVRSYEASSAAGALHEALVEASIQARTLGLQQVLVLNTCRKLVLLFNGFAKPD